MKVYGPILGCIYIIKMKIISVQMCIACVPEKVIGASAYMDVDITTIICWFDVEKHSSQYPEIKEALMSYFAQSARVVPEDMIETFQNMLKEGRWGSGFPSVLLPVPQSILDLLKTLPKENPYDAIM